MESLLTRAMGFAVRAHGDRAWKGSTAPYITHSMEVCAIVSELTEDMEVRAAAVLHGVPGTRAYTLDGLYNYFGSHITNLVQQVTEDPLGEEWKKASRADTWELRKCAFIEKTAACDYKSAQRIILADKLSDLRALERTVARDGMAAWSYFNQPDPERQHWYYWEVLHALNRMRGLPQMEEAMGLLRRIWA